MEFSVQAQPADAASWLALARRAEAEGFARLQVSDHPGSGASPFVALAAAAGVTTRIELGSYVLNAGVREPLLVAADVATLDVVSDGRAVLGVGAGHTPAEWAGVGRTRPGADHRVDRAVAVAGAARRLLDGEQVTLDHGPVRVSGARLEGPLPVRRPVPLLVGGGHPRLLARAAAHADVVALSGLGRTLADGHAHDVRWAPERVDAQVELVRAAADRAGGAGSGPRLEALVQHVELTDDREAAAARLVDEIGGSVAARDLLDVPYVMVGTAAEVADQVRRHAERWGITAYTVRAPAMGDVAAVRAVLTGLAAPG